MNLNGYIGFVRRALPSPFTIAVILTLVTYFLVLLTSGNSLEVIERPLPIEVLMWWKDGLWNPPLLVFALQMMLMLVLGHVLALSPAVDKFISRVVIYCESTSRAAAIVTFFSLLLALFNWGLGLIFGAVFARKVGDHAASKRINLNYPLVGAAGYSGLMIWHCGLSGSSLIKVAEPGHLNQLAGNSGLNLPEVIPMSATFLSSMNVTVMVLALILLPGLMYLIGKKTKGVVPSVKRQVATTHVKVGALVGAEHLDNSPIASRTFGVILIGFVAYIMFVEGTSVIDFFTPNNINLLLLSLCILLHRSFRLFLEAVEEAIVGASGILIQFPLYFGIMGMMNASGLIENLAGFFVSISNEHTYPLLTFFSAGIVNIFVPSGGGQWAIQGPVILQSSMELGVALPKSVLALAYGDQLTNMLQPFWALPLLGITQLSAREILPYTLFLFLAGVLIFGSVLLIF